MRILITGSRDWTNEGLIFSALHRIPDGTGSLHDKHTLVHGGAPGADTIAARWAELHKWELEVHIPNWSSCGSGCGPSHWRYRADGPYCPRSGFIRNDHMVKLGADICLAFIKNESAGATMCANLAEKNGIRTVRYYENTQGENP